MISRTYEIKINLSINEIDKKNWDNLLQDNKNPFYDWNWLSNLENSKSVTRETGWQPLYFLAYLNEELCGIAPLYLKIHSYGEFIFDQQFARLAQDLNLNYYPKLIGMSPYSPIEGYQFIYKENANKSEITKAIILRIEEFAKQNKILSCNFLYVNKEWGEHLKTYGYSDWVNTRSEWQNIGENSFEEFLLRFNSNQRKNIKKERKSIKEQMIKIDIYSEEDLNKEIMINMHNFYEQHCLKWGVWGSKYLTQKFFKDALSNRENLLIFCASNESTEKTIAMSMCIKNKDNLWGRYWGANDEFINLHFELCYYQPIEWAIKNKIQSFDPGAGGSHKRRRGFYAMETKSYHKWFDIRMESIINDWLLRANKQTSEDIELENKLIPFRK